TPRYGARPVMEPGGQSNQHEPRQDERRAFRTCLPAQHPHEPGDGAIERQGEDLAEALHPSPRLRQEATPRGRQAPSEKQQGRPRPSASKTIRATSGGWVIAKPRATPMKGAVQGVAATVARAPVKNVPLYPGREARPWPTPVSRAPITSRPDRLSARAKST